jgi:hypothetical protein
MFMASLRLYFVRLYCIKKCEKMPGLAIKKYNTYNLKSLWGILHTVYAVMKRCLSALLPEMEGSR